MPAIVPQTVVREGTLTMFFTFRSRKKKTSARWCRLALEPLEERLVPSYLSLESASGLASYDSAILTHVILDSPRTNHEELDTSSDSTSFASPMDAYEYHVAHGIARDTYGLSTGFANIFILPRFREE